MVAARDDELEDGDDDNDDDDDDDDDTKDDDDDDDNDEVEASRADDLCASATETTDATAREAERDVLCRAAAKTRWAGERVFIYMMGDRPSCEALCRLSPKCIDL